MLDSCIELKAEQLRQTIKCSSGEGGSWPWTKHSLVVCLQRFSLTAYCRKWTGDTAIMGYFQPQAKDDLKPWGDGGCPGWGRAATERSIEGLRNVHLLLKTLSGTSRRQNHAYHQEHLENQD